MKTQSQQNEVELLEEAVFLDLLRTSDVLSRRIAYVLKNEDLSLEPVQRAADSAGRAGRAALRGNRQPHDHPRSGYYAPARPAGEEGIDFALPRELKTGAWC